MARESKKKKGPEWPNDENGETIPPVFLKRIHGGPLDMELTLNLLEAYGIPYVCEYPNNGLFGKLILGYSPGGMDIFVPESLLEDAQNVLNADIIEEDDFGGGLGVIEDGNIGGAEALPVENFDAEKHEV